MKIIRHVMNGNWDSLPEWDNRGDLLKEGSSSTVAQVVYTLPFILLIIIGGAATSGIANLMGSDDLAAIMATGADYFCYAWVVLFAVALLF